MQHAPVTQLINEVGAIVHYLPPYSPIEWCFSKVKEGIEEEMEATEDIELIARSAFATVTSNDCQNWIDDCGIIYYD